MSGGRKFTSDTLLSAEERLEEMERKYSVIQERIQAYDRVLSEFEVLKKDVKSLRDYGKYLENLTAKESENIFARTLKLTNQIDELSKAHANTNNIVAQFGNNHLLQINKAHQDINQYKIDLKNLYEQSKEHIKRTDVLSTSVSLFNSDLKNTKNTLEDFSKSIKEISKNHGQLKKELSQVSASNIEFSQQSEYLINKIPDFKDWAAQVLIKSDANLNNVKLSLDQKISQGIENVRAELKEDPLTVESVKKEFKKDLESLALDAKNAYLKAGNAAQKIELLEKKLENVNLILKKNELSK